MSEVEAVQIAHACAWKEIVSIFPSGDCNTKTVTSSPHEGLNPEPRVAGGGNIAAVTRALRVVQDDFLVQLVKVHNELTSHQSISRLHVEPLSNGRVPTPYYKDKN